MSAGDFVNSKYQSDEGGIYAIRVQPETLALTINGTANTAPAGDVDQEGLARVSGSRRRIGLKARLVRFRFTAAPTGGGYSVGDILSLPILTQATYNAIPKAGATGTYLGAAIEVVGKSPQGGR